MVIDFLDDNDRLQVKVSACAQPCLWCGESLQQSKPFCNFDCECAFEDMQENARTVPHPTERIEQ